MQDTFLKCYMVADDWDCQKCQEYEIGKQTIPKRILFPKNGEEAWVCPPRILDPDQIHPWIQVWELL